jgi:hypothetical protein
MNLNVSSPLYVKLGVLVFAVALIALSTIPALVTVANWMADAGKVLFGIGLVSIQGNAAAVAKEVTDARAKAEATIKAVE